MIERPAGHKRLCLVLGGRGFIGSHLADRLVEEGYPVRIFDRPASSNENIKELTGRVEIYEGDFQNEKDLAGALDGVGYVFHLISTTLPKKSNEDPIYDIESNVVGTLRMLDHIKDNKEIKIIFVSSGGTVYGMPQKLPIDEDHPTSPLCSYGIGKLTIERYLYLYKHLHGLDYTVLRAANPYGERQNPLGAQGVVPIFMSKMQAAEKITLWGDGEVVRDFIYIDDFIDALIMAMDVVTKDRIFNIGSGAGTSLNDLIKEIESLTGISSNVEYLPSRDTDVPVNYLDISRARNQLGWRPKTPFIEGLKNTWQWLAG